MLPDLDTNVKRSCRVDKIHWIFLSPDFGDEDARLCVEVHSRKHFFERVGQEIFPALSTLLQGEVE